MRQHGLETAREPNIGACEEGKVFPCRVQELDTPRRVDGFYLWVLGELEPGGVGSGVVFAEAGDDAGVPVGAGGGVGEIGTFAEECAVDVEGVGGGGFADHEVLNGEVGEADADAERS